MFLPKNIAALAPLSEVKRGDRVTYCTQLCRVPAYHDAIVVDVYPSAAHSAQLVVPGTLCAWVGAADIAQGRVRAPRATNMLVICDRCSGTGGAWGQCPKCDNWGAV